MLTLNFISFNKHGLTCTDPHQITTLTTIKSTKCVVGGNGKLYCLGGLHQTNGNGVQHVHHYDYAANLWTKISNIMPIKIWGGAAITLDDGNIWYIGKDFNGVFSMYCAYYLQKLFSLLIYLFLVSLNQGTCLLIYGPGVSLYLLHKDTGHP